MMRRSVVMSTMLGVGPPVRQATPAPAADDLLRVATWNVHDAVGRDGRRDLTRVGSVITTLSAPIVGLQEVACGPGDSCDIQELARATGLAWRAVPTRRHGARVLQRGNALLTSLPVLAVKLHDLSIAGREPRAALEADLLWKQRRLRVVVTHLGLRAGERRRQVRRLLAAVSDDGSDATILLGDINEWFMWGRPLRWLHRRFGTHPAVRTFPAALPLLALDRVWAHPPRTLVTIATEASYDARRASDHLPVVATLRFPR